jgi:YVTN family beta-propeller protein
MASVYEATDLRLNRTVALKVLAPEISESADFRERFIRESRFAASLDHPNIVPIYEAGEADGRLYIAMRYVRGGNLAESLRKCGALDPKRALAILSPVADALDTAHNAGLVHRDVKPANILLTSVLGHEWHGHVYLTDFGLTKRTSALTKLTASGKFIGTMTYVSPEQIRGEPLDARTDLYALGCVAYECLTGVPPFVRDDEAALLWAHLNDPPAPVSVHMHDLLPADPVVAKALSKDPLDRYESCEEFTQSLSDALLTGRHSAVNLLATASGLGERSSARARSPAGEAELVTTPVIEDGQQAVQGGEDSPPVPSGTHPATAEPSPPAGPPGGSDSPSSQPPPLADGPSPDDGPEHSPQEPPDVAVSSAGPISPPLLGPPPMIRRRRTRRRTVLTLVAAVLAVAAIVAVAVVLRPTTQTVEGTGRPAGVSVITEATGSPSGTSATSTDASAGVDTATQQVAPAPPATASFQPAPPVPFVVPAPSLAIPTVDGNPVAVGETPGFVAISPDGRLAYIARRAAGVVTVLDTAINKVVADVPIPAGPPQFIAFTPDGSRAYVSVYNADLTINAVAVLDTRTTKLVETIPVNKKPYALAVSPDQKFVYVPSHDAAVIDIIDIAANKVVQSVPVAPNPHWVTFDADGTFAYIANHDSNLVSVMETASNTVIDTIDVGISPHSIAVSPDGKQVAVVCFDSNDVYFIDTQTHGVLGIVPVGKNPQDLTYSPDGRYVYTANVDASTVSVVDTESRTVTATIPTDSPTSIGVLPNGRKAYVTNLNAGTLTILNAGG